LSSGPYVITVTDSEGCTITVPFTIEIISSAEQESADYLFVYPNPARDFLHCTPLAEKASLKIMDTKGRLWFEKPADRSCQEIPVVDFPSGLYIILARFDQKIYLQKIIKL